MNSPYLSGRKISLFIKNALAEDHGDGDHSSIGCIPVKSRKHAKLLIKADGILAGIELAEKIFKTYSPEIQFEKLMEDGDMTLV